MAPHLAHILQGIKQVYNKLDWFSCGHIYHELNTLADKLSKEALQLIPQVLENQEYLWGLLPSISSFLSHLLLYFVIIYVNNPMILSEK